MAYALQIFPQFSMAVSLQDDGAYILGNTLYNRALCGNHMVKRYSDIYRVQMPNITPHVCRHIYCSNMAKSGMTSKTLQYLMGHSDIGVTLNTYTHLELEDAADELKRMEKQADARKELEKVKGEKPVSQKMFRAI